MNHTINKKNLMKKPLIILVIFLFTLNSNAQWFLGGEIGLNVRNYNEKSFWEDSEHTRKISKVGFLIAPKVGYFFNEKLAFGINFSVGPDFTNESEKNLTRGYKYRRTSVNWSVFPFVRYSVFTYKKFFVALEVRTGVGGSHSFWKYENLTTKKGYTTFAIGVLNVTPVLGFNLTDHLQIEAGLHFLNVGYNIDITKGKDYYVSHTEPEVEISERKINITKHDLNIGFNSSSILVVTQLKFGVIYKF